MGLGWSFDEEGSAMDVLILRNKRSYFVCSGSIEVMYFHSCSLITSAFSTRDDLCRMYLIIMLFKIDIKSSDVYWRVTQGVGESISLGLPAACS